MFAAHHQYMSISPVQLCGLVAYWSAIETFSNDRKPGNVGSGEGWGL